MTDAKALNLLPIRAVEAASVDVTRSRVASMTDADLLACLVMVHQAQQDLRAVRQRLVQEMVSRGVPITKLSPDTARRIGEDHRRRSTADPSARST
ncbi:MAG TPA: hypothetical protein VF657_07390 [Actinoplanes sp.]|jgi:hypothetical protein